MDGALARSHLLLRCLAGHPDGLGFAELRRRAGDLVPATLSRLLKALIAEGLVQQEEGAGRYRSGPALRDLARRCLGRTALEIIQAQVDRLSEVTGQSAMVAEAVGGEPPGMVRVARAIAENSPGIGALDQRLFILAHALGIPLVAALDPTARDSALRHHAQHSGDDPAEMDTCLSTLARDGVLVRGERLRSSSFGCTRIVAPLTVRGRPAAALGITAFGRLDNGLEADRVATWKTQVRQAAARLTADLEGLP